MHVIVGDCLCLRSRKTSGPGLLIQEVSTSLQGAAVADVHRDVSGAGSERSSQMTQQETPGRLARAEQKAHCTEPLGAIWDSPAAADGPESAPQETGHPS